MPVSQAFRMIGDKVFPARSVISKTEENSASCTRSRLSSIPWSTQISSYSPVRFPFSLIGSCFFSGRGRTWAVLAVNAASTVVNIVLDYVLIFGYGPIPEFGIVGAAWATNIDTLFSALVFCVLFLGPRHRRKFATLSGWRPQRDLILRLLKFGGPNGLTFMLDMLVFSLFILLVGRLGTVELAATNLAFNINSLAFMPLIGCGIAITTMVGQRLGANRPEAAAYCTWTGLHLALAYMGCMAAAYLLVPDVFLSPYGFRSDSADFIAARAIAVNLLRFIAVYCLFDAFYMVFTAALKGAGDTRFIMIASVVLGWAMLVLPSVLWLRYVNNNIYVLWSFVCAYIITMGIVFFFRFRHGKWKSMRVIEEVPCPPAEEAPRFHEAKAGT